MLGQSPLDASRAREVPLLFELLLSDFDAILSLNDTGLQFGPETESAGSILTAARIDKVLFELLNEFYLRRGKRKYRLSQALFFSPSLLLFSLLSVFAYGLCIVADAEVVDVFLNTHKYGLTAAALLDKLKEM